MCVVYRSLLNIYGKTISQTDMSQTITETTIVNRTKRKYRTETGNEKDITEVIVREVDREEMILQELNNEQPGLVELYDIKYLKVLQSRKERARRQSKKASFNIQFVWQKVSLAPEAETQPRLGEEGLE